MVRLEERDRCWPLLLSQRRLHPSRCDTQELGYRAETRHTFNIVGGLGRRIPAYNRGYDRNLMDNYPSTMQQEKAGLRMVLREYFPLMSQFGS